MSEEQPGRLVVTFLNANITCEPGQAGIALLTRPPRTASFSRHMPEAVATSHIWLDSEGRAWIDKTNVKVIEVVLDHLAYGWSPEEMHYQHPHLSLAQIHAALAYYFDRQAEFDAQVEAGLRRAERMAGESKDSPLRQRLRRLGKLP